MPESGGKAVKSREWCSRAEEFFVNIEVYRGGSVQKIKNKILE